jgi:hypothetical protein
VAILAPPGMIRSRASPAAGTAPNPG